MTICGIMKNTLLLLAVLLALTGLQSATFAATEVKSECCAAQDWKFKTIASPSRSAPSRNAAITVVGQHQSSCMPASALRNGVMPRDGRQVRDFFTFADGSDGGLIVMDLGKTIPVASVNGYSWHGERQFYDGSRGPQVYTLYGSAAEKPDTATLDGPDWKKIAEVDTRPNRTGQGWGGQWGVNIKDDKDGLLGNFRWLVWKVKRTNRPGSRPDWSNTWYAELDVHTPGTATRSGDFILAGSQLKEVVIAYKTHFDIGFTHPAPEIVNIYRTSMIDHALRVIDESRKLPPEERFAWTIPSWVAWQILWPGQNATRRARVIQAMKEGSLVVHALPVTLQTESLSLEDLASGLEIHAKVCREAGIPLSRAGKMTDVPSHSWIWPTLCKHAGIDSLHIGVNSCNEKPDLPLLYNWEGPDGSQLLTFHNSGYGSDVEQGRGLYPPKDWPYQHWLAMIMTSDNEGPPSVGQVRGLLAEAKRNLPGVKITLGRMEDFADAIRAEEKASAKVPVVRCDMPDTWIHGMGSLPVEDAAAHRMRMAISAVESLDAHLRIWRLPRPDIRQDLFTAHERSLMYGEHTWGGSRNLQGQDAYGITDFEQFVKTDGTCRYLQKTWDDHAAYMRKASAITAKLETREIEQLAAAVKQDGKRMVVFNPLPWKHDAWVDIPGRTGAKVLVKDLPPSGYKTLPVPELNSAAPTACANGVLENAFLRVTVDREKGGIVSIIEKKTGRELVDPMAPHAFGQYLYERYDKKQCDAYNEACYLNTSVYGLGAYGWNNRADLPANSPYTNAAPRYSEMSVARDAAAQTATLRADAGGLIASKVTTTITLPNDAPWLEIAIRLDDKKPDYWPENGSFYFPVNAAKPQFRIGRLGGIADPTKDFVPHANRTYGYVSTGAMIADENGKGVAICPLDHGIMSFGKKGLCEIAPDYVPATPEAKVSLFNNLWTINFPYWIQGTMTSRIRVWATDDLLPASLNTPALEARMPVLAAIADGTSGTLPSEQAGLALSRTGVQATAFREAADWMPAGTLLRLWEQAGVAGELTVTLPGFAKFTTATPVNLRGEKTSEPLAIRDGKFTFSLRAYAPASFILSPGLPTSTVVRGGPTAVTRLTNLDMSGISQAWGTPQINKSVAGSPLRVGGADYQSGFGTHAPMTWDIDLDGQGVTFTTQVGMQDLGEKGKGSVEFVVLGDDKVLFKSAVLRSGDKAVPVELDLAGVHKLTLQVTDAGDGNSADHADWLAPEITHTRVLE